MLTYALFRKEFHFFQIKSDLLRFLPNVRHRENSCTLVGQMYILRLDFIRRKTDPGEVYRLNFASADTLSF